MHSPDGSAFERRLNGWTIYGAPTTWLALDFDNNCLAPPGWRTFTFRSNGSIDNEVGLVTHADYEDPKPLPEWLDRVLLAHFGVSRRR